MPRMSLLSPCVPVGWRVALFGGLGDDVDVCLEGGRPGGASGGYASLGGPVGGHSIDLVESGLRAKFFRGACRPWPFPSCFRGINHLTFTLLPTLR